MEVGLVATPARLSRAPGFVTQLLTGPVVTDLVWRPRIPHGKDRAARRDPLPIGIDGTVAAGDGYRLCTT